MILVYFLCKNPNPLLKKLYPLSQQSPSKNWDPVKPLLFEKLVGASIQKQKEGEVGGAHYIIGKYQSVVRSNTIIDVIWTFAFTKSKVFYNHTIWKHFLKPLSAGFHKILMKNLLAHFSMPRWFPHLSHSYHHTSNYPSSYLMIVPYHQLYFSLY